MNVVKRFFVQLRAFARTAFALVCISLALLVGVANLLLPYADRYRPQIESWLSERLGQPVSIRRLDAEWAAFGPRVYLEGLTVGRPDDENRLEVAMANVGLDFFSWIKPGREGIQTFRVTVDHIELTRNEAGQWRLGGFAGPSGNVRSRGNPLSWLQGPSLIGFNVGSVVLRDEAMGRTLHLPGGDFRFNNHGDHQHVSGLIGGPLDGRVRIAAEHALDSDETRIYLEADALDLSRWLDEELAGVEVTDGELAFRVWGELSPGSRDWHGRFTLNELEIESDAANAIQSDYRVDALEAEFAAWFAPDDRGLRLDALTLERNGSSWQSEELGFAIVDDGYRLVADRLQLQDLVDALVLAPMVPVAIREQLIQIQPRGTARAVDLQISVADGSLAIDGRADLAELSWQRDGNIPGVSNADVQLELAGESADLALRLDNATVDFGERFRAPFETVTLAADGRVEWTGTPVITFSEWQLEHLGTQLAGTARFVLNGQRPFVDIAARLFSADVHDAHHYWPVTKFPASLVDWLDNAPQQGHVSEGSMVLFGDLDHWPFFDNQGRFQVQARLEDAIVDYRPGWPAARDLVTILSMDSIGLSAAVEAATIGNVTVDRGTIDIPRLRQPVLTAVGRGHGDGNDLLAFLRNTPLAEKYSGPAEGLSVDGPATIALELVLPLKPELGELDVAGEIGLDDAHVVDSKWDIEFGETTGGVRFSEGGFEAVELAAQFRGTPSRLTVRAGEFVTDPELAAEGVLSATSNPGILLTDFPPLMPLTSYIEGSAPWEARITMPDAPGSQPRLELVARLAAANISLPPPLSKPSGPRMPLRVSFDLSEPLDEFEMAIGEVGALHALRLPSGDWSAGLHFGSDSAPRLSDAGLTVTGRVPHVDLDGWLELYNRLGLSLLTAGDDQPMLNSIDITIDELTLAARRFRDLELHAYQQGEYWYVDLAGPQADGQLRLPAELDENRLMLAEFEYLEWPESDTEREAPDTDIDPRNYPPMDFYAAQLQFGQANLGTVRFESFPTQRGMRIDTFETESPYFDLAAAGDWLSAGLSQFSVTLTAEDLGEALEGFGFTGMVEDGQLIAMLDAQWPGAPSDFELAALSGELELTVGKGLITEIDPGAGRIFGLLSLQALPRRLLLDFSDLFKSGLAFDRISGHFELRDGTAHTSDLAIEGPTADVYIQGRTDLADRDYDQIITVVPKVGEALPLVGAIAGGGVGAAAVLLLQNVFSNQIERMTQYHYSVTGPWEEPDVELIGANQSRLDMERLKQRKEG